MAGRFLAQILVQGSVLVFRAAAQAYQQALINGQRAGGAEALKRATRASGLTLQEARQILGVEPGATWEQIEQKYKHLYNVNTETSHYLLSKVFRAKEALDIEFADEARAWRQQHPGFDPHEDYVKSRSKGDEDGDAKSTAGSGRSSN